MTASRARLHQLMITVLSVVALLLVWQVASGLGDLSVVIPAPLVVLKKMTEDASYYPGNVGATLRSALLGYLLGNGIAIILAVGSLPFPRLQTFLERLSVGAIALPLVAIAPLLAIAFQGSTPSVILAAQAVIFTTLVGAVLGLQDVDKTSVEVVRSTGGSEWTVIRKVRLPSAVPQLLAGLQVAAPSAILGAIIGEYMGGERGLGVAMIQAQGSFDVPRAWGLAIVTSVLAALAYVLLPVLVRLTMPWAIKVDTVLGTRSPNRRPRRSVPARIALALRNLIITLAVLLVIWIGVVRLVPGGDAVARGPFQVIPYFTAGEAQMVTASGDTQTPLAYMWSSLLETLYHASVGFVVGTVLAVLVSILAHEFAVVERILLPLSITMRSVPIVAVMPLLALIFGRGIVAVTVLITAMTFFPTLVNMLAAMKAVPRSAADLFRAIGAGRIHRVVGLRVPYALPALAASVKISLPLSIGAAMVAEWLATGDGLGASMTVAATLSDYNFVWGGVIVVLLASLAAYQIAAAIERVAVSRLE